MLEKGSDYAARELDRQQKAKEAESDARAAQYSAGDEDGDQAGSTPTSILE